MEENDSNQRLIGSVYVLAHVLYVFLFIQIFKNKIQSFTDVFFLFLLNHDVQFNSRYIDSHLWNWPGYHLRQTCLLGDWNLQATVRFYDKFEKT